MANINQEPKVNSSYRHSRRTFLAMSAGVIAGAAVPNPNLSVFQKTQVNIAEAAPAPAVAAAAGCDASLSDRFTRNLTDQEQSGLQLTVTRVTNIRNSAGEIVEQRNEPAVGNDYLIESVQHPEQRVVATVRNIEGVGVAKQIVRRRHADGSLENTTGTDTFIYTGFPDTTARINLVCDDIRKELEVPAIKIKISRFNGVTKPATYIDTVASAIRCNPRRQTFTSTIEQPAPATPTPERKPTATPTATPEGGSQSPIPSGSQSPLSETDPTLGEQFGLVPNMPEGQFFPEV